MEEKIYLRNNYAGTSFNQRQMKEQTETLIRSHFSKCLLDFCPLDVSLLTLENGKMPI